MQMSIWIFVHFDIQYVGFKYGIRIQRPRLAATLKNLDKYLKHPLIHEPKILKLSYILFGDIKKIFPNF